MHVSHFTEGSTIHVQVNLNGSWSPVAGPPTATPTARGLSPKSIDWPGSAA
jgi:hypothetical protein